MQITAPEGSSESVLAEKLSVDCLVPLKSPSCEVHVLISDLFILDLAPILRFAGGVCD
jgi:hypothetical protein